MVRIPNDKQHEVTSEGLRIFVEGPSSIALTSPEAQRLVYNYAKESGFREYGMNKFVAADPATKEGAYPAQGYWLLIPSQWNTRSVRV